MANAALLASLGLDTAPTLQPPDLLRANAGSSAQAYFEGLRERKRALLDGGDMHAAEQLVTAGVWSLCQFIQQDLTG